MYLIENKSITKSDYYPFGAVMYNRGFSTANGYKYGFQGSEKDNEIKGNGNSYTTEFREYDPRLGRWFSIDPLTSQFPWQSPYAAFDNNPILKSDPKGDAPSVDNQNSEDRKTRKFERKERQLSRKTGLVGDQLREKMYEKYGNRNWAYIKTADATNKSGVNGYTPTGDMVDFKNGVTVTKSSTTTTTDAIVSNQDGTVDPYPITLNPGETATVTATNATTNDGGANQIAISQNGTNVSSGSVTNNGDCVSANVDGNNGQVIVSVTMGAGNLRTVNNPTGTAGRGTWDFQKTLISATKTSTTTKLKFPRTIQYSGSFYGLIKAGAFKN